MNILDLLEDFVSPVRKHRVQWPENLATLSQHYYGCTDHANAIYQANRSSIEDPNRIYPGQMLVIPHLPHVTRTTHHE